MDEKTGNMLVKFAIREQQEKRIAETSAELRRRGAEGVLGAVSTEALVAELIRRGCIVVSET